MLIALNVKVKGRASWIPKIRKNTLLSAGPGTGKTRIIVAAILCLACFHRRDQLVAFVIYTNDTLKNQDHVQYEAVDALLKSGSVKLTIHRCSSWAAAKEHDDFKDAAVFFFDEIDHKMLDQAKDDPVDFLNMQESVVGLTATAPGEGTTLKQVVDGFEFWSLVPSDDQVCEAKKPHFEIISNATAFFNFSADGYIVFCNQSDWESIRRQAKRAHSDYEVQLNPKEKGWYMNMANKVAIITYISCMRGLDF